jgi:superfamily II DNA or RNA helicase
MTIAYSDPPAPSPQRVAHTVVQRHIAVAVLRRYLTTAEVATPAKVLGDITLTSRQHESAARVGAVLARHSVALLADATGSGKTFVALAVARALAAEHPSVQRGERPRVVVVAPAALLSTWRSAIARSGLADLASPTVQSLQSLSRLDPGASTSARYAHSAGDAIVIVDEAHHLRTVSTRRYRALAALLGRVPLLLISATPLINRVADLRSLLRLGGVELPRGRGARDSVLGEVVVRTVGATAGRPKAAASTAEPPSSVGALPRIVRTRAVRVPAMPRLLHAILELPAPVATRDGRVAAALVRLGLVRAWCSSDAALSTQLRRRAERGAAMLEALSAGGVLSASELREWTIGDDATQLAMPTLLMDASAPEIAASERDALAAQIRKHVDAIRTIEATLRTGERTVRGHALITPADAARVDALRALLHERPDARVVAFSQFASTVHHVARALADIAGVGSLTGARGHIASGPIARDELIQRFAPRANGVPPPPAREQVRLLLTTDVLSEGVNLQDADTVVHLDLPWTAALAAQRVGRAARLGSRHAAVRVITMVPHTDGQRTLALVARVRHKARLAARLIAPVGTVPVRAFGRADRSHRDARSVYWQGRWIARCREWAQATPSHAALGAGEHAMRPSVPTIAPVSVVAVSMLPAGVPSCALLLDARGRVAAVETRRAGAPHAVDYCVRRSPRALYRVARRLVASAPLEAIAATPPCTEFAAALARDLRRQQLRARLRLRGVPTAPRRSGVLSARGARPECRAPNARDVRRRAVRVARALLAKISVAQRARLEAPWRRYRAVVHAARRPAEVESVRALTLAAPQRAPSADAVERWLISWTQYGALHALSGAPRAPRRPLVPAIRAQWIGVGT